MIDMETLLYILSAGWLLALFTKSPYSSTVSGFFLPKLPSVAYAVACPLCLGWYVGFTAGSVQILTAGASLTWPLILAFGMSASSYIFRVFIEVLGKVMTWSITDDSQ